MTRTYTPLALVVLATIALISFGNLGCSARYDEENRQRFGDIKQGMSIKTVERLLGQPVSRVAEGNDQMFVYAVKTMNQPPGGPNLRIEGYYVVFTNGYVQSGSLGYCRRDGF